MNAGVLERKGLLTCVKNKGCQSQTTKKNRVVSASGFIKTYTEENLRRIGLNERQTKAVMLVKERGKITNKEYREMFGVTDRSALRDLMRICEKGIF